MVRKMILDCFFKLSTGVSKVITLFILGLVINVLIVQRSPSITKMCQLKPKLIWRNRHCEKDLFTI